MVSAQGRKGRGKEKSRRFASGALLSPSRGPLLSRPQFLVLRARLLATEIEAPEKEAVARV